MNKSITPLSAISALMIVMVGVSLVPAVSQAQTPQMVLVATTATMTQRSVTSSWGSPPINFASVRDGSFSVAPIPAPRGSDLPADVRPVGLHMPAPRGGNLPPDIRPAGFHMPAILAKN